MARAIEMTYVALRRMTVGGKTREPGDLVPEAATFHNLDAYLKTGRVTAVPVDTVNEGELKAAVSRMEAQTAKNKRQAEESASEEAAEETSTEPEPDEDDALAQYHTGQGWYEVPGSEKKMRRDEALEFLTSSENDEE